MSDLLAENALIDAKQVAESLDREFMDSDIAQYREAGVDLALGAVVFVQRYTGSNRFMNNVLKPALNNRNSLTAGQARTALNIMRQELLGVTRPEKPKTMMKCFNCDAEYDTWDELNAHKSQMHGSKKLKQEPVADIGPAEDVLEVTASKLGLDLSNLPDGRYAAPDTSGKNDYIFLAVKRVRKTVKRDRRYVYGKIVTGNEIVVAGTIEVRIWSSDTKEWVGQQKPQDVYRGKYEEQLDLIMLAPEAWATLFGKLLGYCARCGKKLTDDVSRQIGLGLDCERYLAEGYFKKAPKYTFIGTDRPDAEKANPYDQTYLSGKSVRWVEPWECVEGHAFCTDHNRKR